MQKKVPDILWVISTPVQPCTCLTFRMPTFLLPTCKQIYLGMSLGDEEVAHGRAEGPSATGDGGEAAISLTSDGDGTGSGSLLDSILATLLKK